MLSSNDVAMLSHPCGLWSIASPMDMLDAEKVPAGGILDGRLGERMAGASCCHERYPHPIKRSRGWSSAVRGESTPCPVTSRERLGWGGFPRSVIRAKKTMFMAVKNPGARKSVSSH